MLDVNRLHMGDRVRVVNKSRAWHIMNNKRKHLKCMNCYIGQIGSIVGISYADNYVRVKFITGDVYTYSYNCLQPVWYYSYSKVILSELIDNALRMDNCSKKRRIK